MYKSLILGHGCTDEKLYSCIRGQLLGHYNTDCNNSHNIFVNQNSGRTINTINPANLAQTILRYFAEIQFFSDTRYIFRYHPPLRLLCIHF